MKPKNTKRLLLFVCSLLALITINFSCRKEFSLENFNGSFLPDSELKVYASIQGVVTDINGNPIQGALVSSGIHTTFTNEFGSFFFNEIQTPQSNTKIEISRDGYFNQYKSLEIAAGTDNFFRVQLIDKILSGSIESNVGGEVKLPNGATISIPSDAIRNENGNPYTGKVNVYMYWMDPTRQSTLSQMPGDLRGITSENQERMLITYGMLNVELESPQKTKLQLDSTKPATVSFPNPSANSGQSRATVPMWHYDTKKGIWMEDGSATLKDNFYETKVKHFSCWNVDATYNEPLVDFCFYIVDEKKRPYSNVHILIRREEDRWGAHGYTNCEGYVCGKIPSNTPLILEILGDEACEGKLVYTKIGPYSQKVKGEIIVLEKKAEQTVTVYGKAVDCDGKSIVKGYIQANVKGNGFIGKVKDGKFEFTLTKCIDSKSLDVFGVDEIKNKLSDLKTFAINDKEMDLGTITICADPTKTNTMGLMGYYPLNGNANDLAPSPANGNLIGAPVFVEDHKGAPGKALALLPAVLFDSTKPLIQAKAGQFVDIPGSAGRNYMPITVSFWCKLDADAPNVGNLLSKYIAASWNGIELLFSKDIASGKFYLIPWYLNSSANRIIGDYGEPPFRFEIPTDKWMHLVMTVSDKEAKIYMNNLLLGKKKWTGTAKSSTNSFNWKIGGTYDNQWFKGSIDEVRIYNRVILQDEIKYLYEN